MADDIEVKWNPGVQKEITETVPDRVMYQVARMTLDMSYSSIPLSKMKNAGKLRQTSMAAGVRGASGDYYIGSYTNYAKYVWEMNDKTTNWSTPATHSRWYERVWKEKGKSILSTAVERNKLK